MTDPSKKLFVFVGLLMSLVDPQNGLSQINHWGAFGPVGGYVQAAAVDPQSPATIYAAPTEGLFKSVDGGANWRRLPGLEYVWVTSIVIDSQNSNNVYVTSWARVFKSTDAGMTWNMFNFQPVTGSLNHPGLYVLAIDSQNPATIYAGHWNGCQGACPAAAPIDGLFKSTDAGATWKKTPLTSVNVYSIAANPREASVLYAGTATGVYESRDAGETWRKIAAIDVMGWGSVVAPDPLDASTVYVGTADGVFKTTNGGRDWNQILRFGYVNPFGNLLVDPHDSSIVYATSWDGSFKSTDAGANWQDLGASTPWPLAWDPKTAGTIYATRWEHDIDQSLFLKTTDGGASWRRLYSGIVATSVSIGIDPKTADSMYAWTGHRLFKSTDGARRWSLVSLSPATQRAFLDVAIDAQNSRILYASKQSGVYKSTDGGLNWNPANTGLPSGMFVHHLHVDPQSSGTVYGSSFNKDPFPAGRPISTDFWNALFKTTDGGTSWIKIGSEILPETRPLLSLAVSRQNLAKLYAGYYHPTSAELYRSIDGGKTWSNVAFPSTGPVTFMDITVDPQTDDTVYVVAGCALFKSIDGGTNWTPITSRVADCLTYARLEVESGNTLYAATGRLFRSTDGGISWTLDSGIRGAVTNFAIDRNSSRKYATVTGGGVYTAFDSPPQETPLPSLTLNSTGCIGQSWSLQVSGAESNSAIHLFGNSNGQTWEIDAWDKTNALGAYEATGTFFKDSEGRHTLYVDVDGVTSNDVSFRVLDCS